MDITINFDFNGVMIGELQIKLIQNSALVEDGIFVNEMARAAKSLNLFTVFDTFNERIRSLVENDFIKPNFVF